MLDQNSQNTLMLDPVYKKYIQMQIEQMETQKAEREQASAILQEQGARKKLMQLREAHDQEARRKQVEASQQYCPHRQGTMPLVRGQRLGGNKHYIFCQFCLKHWDDWSQVPATLHSPMEYYGGPVGF